MGDEQPGGMTEQQHRDVVFQVRTTYVVGRALNVIGATLALLGTGWLLLVGIEPGIAMLATGVILWIAGTGRVSKAKKVMHVSAD